jgi:hypothetical protein
MTEDPTRWIESINGLMIEISFVDVSDKQLQVQDHEFV